VAWFRGRESPGTSRRQVLSRVWPSLLRIGFLGIELDLITWVCQILLHAIYFENWESDELYMLKMTRDTQWWWWNLKK
jgi:hypothetical protein